MLWLIWISSIGLGAAALATMSVLVVLRLLHDRRTGRSSEERRRVLTALIRFSEDDDRPALVHALRPIRSEVIAAAGFEFLEMLRGEERERIETVFADIGLPHSIRQRLNHGNEADRIHATEMLAAFPGPETVRSLEDALRKDRAREVRIAAAIALSTLQALPALDATLASIGVRGQRSRRLVELFQSLPAERFDELAAYATRTDHPSFIRAAAIDALSLSSSYGLLALFDRLAEDAAPEVAAAAIRALGRYGHPTAYPTLLAAMQNPDWQIRSEAAEAAGRMGIERAVEPLSELLDDGEWAVRYAAGRSLKALGPPGLEELRRMAEDEGSRRQRTASMVLTEGQLL